jgi:hypothetical protein
VYLVRAWTQELERESDKERECPGFSGQQPRDQKDEREERLVAQHDSHLFQAQVRYV